MDDKGDIEVPLQCVLHIGGDKEYDGDAVVPFNEQTWGRACEIAQARKQNQKITKYSAIFQSVKFEGEPLSNHGFHRSCYSKFTAYQTKAITTKQSSDAASGVETRSMVENPRMATTSSSGVLEKKCIFCHGPNRKHFKNTFETLAACETIQAQESIITSARQLEDKQFLREYEHIDFIAKEVVYHNTC